MSWDIQMQYAVDISVWNGVKRVVLSSLSTEEACVCVCVCDCDTVVVTPQQRTVDDSVWNDFGTWLMMQSNVGDVYIVKYSHQRNDIYKDPQTLRE